MSDEIVSGEELPKPEPVILGGPQLELGRQETTMPAVARRHVELGRQEATMEAEKRGWIALLLVVGFLVLVALPVVAWLLGAETDGAVKLLTTVSSILSGIVGAVVGYYFRARQGPE